MFGQHKGDDRSIGSPAFSTDSSMAAANLLLVAIVVALLILRVEVLTSVSVSLHASLIAGLAIVLAPILMAAGHNSTLRALSTVTAVRNMSVALLLAARIFDDPEVEAAILIWSFWMLLLSGLTGWMAGRYRTSEAAANPRPRPALQV